MVGLFGLVVAACVLCARADLLAALDTQTMDGTGTGSEVVRIVSSAPLGPRLNESDFAVAFSEWSAAGQPAGYASCTLSLEVSCAEPVSYLATLTAAPANLTVLPSLSRPVCATVAPASVCTATLVVVAPYSTTVQSYRVAVALDPIGAGNAASVFIALAAPLDPCPAELLVEAALPSLPPSNPMQIAIHTNASTFVSTVTASLRNDGLATTDFYAMLSCPSAVAIVYPDTALRCTLAATSSCPVEWTVVPLQPGLMACQMRFAVARLPCWSSANKFFETQIAIVVPTDDAAVAGTIVAAVVAGTLGLAMLVVLALVIAWATAGCLRVRTDADAAKSRAYAANFFRTRLQRKPDPALSFVPLRDRDTLDE